MPIRGWGRRHPIVVPTDAGSGESNASITSTASEADRPHYAMTGGAFIHHPDLCPIGEHPCPILTYACASRMDNSTTSP